MLQYLTHLDMLWLLLSLNATLCFLAAGAIGWLFKGYDSCKIVHRKPIE